MAGERIGREVSEATELQYEEFSKDSGNMEVHKGRKYDQENILAALILLLGPETDYAMRVRVTRRLARQGPSVLPILLAALNTYPEITSPTWPWWPPQYEHVSRLLLHLSARSKVSLDALLRYPVAAGQLPGSVLWTSVMEAAGLLLHADYEVLLREGLTAPWYTVRYAAAMALAKLATRVTLQASTLEVLHEHQGEDEDIPVLLAASCALLHSSDSRGLEVLIQLLRLSVEEEVRKAAVFVLAVEFSAFSREVSGRSSGKYFQEALLWNERKPQLSPFQQQQLSDVLLEALQDQNAEIALHAAQALRNVASPSILSSLYALLDSARAEVQVAVLTALEEIAGRKALRHAISHAGLPGLVASLLRSSIAEVRRQAGYTLAAFGGEYAAAVLGTTLLEREHPAHVEAIEALRLLPGILRNPIRTKVVGWLLSTLQSAKEEIQVTALDSLGYLLWQARSRARKDALRAISNEIVEEGTALELLRSSSSLVRQRAVELVGMLDHQPSTLHTQLLNLLHFDSDSGVRACVAHILGQTATRWAIPALLEALLDPDEHVAETALKALGSLAGRDDAIVVYVVKELAACDSPNGSEFHHLVPTARRLLKRWGASSRAIPLIKVAESS